ncbi:peptidoglycan bridge formation glycyltransferase FemA/FemB family protein [Candidatus Saccharibacteria bacterium]|nr:peptidoglycan bridge formation glycyltransferase FemA/FemB family protein [Candidatus Saccharibacteria bacterium]
MEPNIEARIVEEHKHWQEFMDKHEEANFLQSWNWGLFHENLGHKAFRTGFYRGEHIVGGMLTIVEDARRGRYLTVPAGPIIDWKDQDLVQASVREMQNIARENKCVFVRVRPQLHDNKETRLLFSELGFKPAPMHLHAELTSQLDLTISEEDLLKNMRKKTRYEIRQADKKGIKVTASTDIKKLEDFYDLQIETSKRQGFVPFSEKFLHEQFKAFSRDDQVLLYRAEHEGEVLAEAYVVFYGEEAAYHYGASTPAGRQLPGAYAIQWAAIREAKRRGLQRYNFWGVTKPDETDHRFYGVSVFKRGFGGEDVSYLHAHDLVINKLGYLKNSLVENVRKRIRHV